MGTLGGIVAGALIGWFVARQKGLIGLDRAHYAGVGAIALGIVTVLALVVMGSTN